MRRSTALALLAAFLAAALTAFPTPVAAFGRPPNPSGGGNGGVEFQANPFLSPHASASLSLEDQKRAANALLPDPTPGERIIGPSVHRAVDPASPCTVGKLDRINEAAVRPTLEDLVATTFFRYFKVDTEAACPFWVMNRMCQSGGGCHVCKCDDNDIPLPWRVEKKSHPAVVKPLPMDFKRWDDVDQNMWAHTQADFSHPDAVYVNLIDNPESNTGYSGAEPRRIWDAIYQENCFRVLTTDNVDQMCLEERVFYRLISGLHTSITVHVFARWKRDLLTNEWLANQGLWNNVFGRFPDRLDNLYFTLDFLLRSLRRAAPYLGDVPIDTGNPVEDARTRELFLRLASLTAPAPAPALAAATGASSAGATAAGLGPGAVAAAAKDDFDEKGYDLFVHQDQIQLKDDLKSMFRNVSVILNCVGCEKCRIWGKLNILGIATALKITLAQPGAEREAIIRSLQRNEVVAWVNTLASFSESVHFVRKHMILDESPVAATAAAASGDSGMKDAPPTSLTLAAAAAAAAEAAASAAAAAAGNCSASASAAAAAAAAATGPYISALCARASEVAKAIATAATESVAALKSTEPQAWVMYLVTTALLVVGGAALSRSMLPKKITQY